MTTDIPALLARAKEFDGWTTTERVTNDLVRDLAAALEKVQAEANLDYDGMRDMQAKFVRADHERIKYRDERDAALALLRLCVPVIRLVRDGTELESSIDALLAKGDKA